MKVGRRSAPLDMLSVEKKDKKVLIYTHHAKIILNAAPQGCCGSDLILSFEELYDLIVTQSAKTNPTKL